MKSGPLAVLGLLALMPAVHGQVSVDLKNPKEPAKATVGNVTVGATPAGPDVRVSGKGAAVDAINKPGQLQDKALTGLEKLHDAPIDALKGATARFENELKQQLKDLEAWLEKELLIGGLILVAMLISTSFIGNLLALKVAQRRGTKH